MKKLQNSLYLTRNDLYAHKEREAIVIKQGQETVTKLPVHGIGNIYCFGQSRVSPALMAHCAENNVNLAYFDQFGRYQARVHGKQSGNVFLRRAQYRASERSLFEQSNIEVARNIIAAKIQNSRAVLQRSMRNHGPNDACRQVVELLKFSVRKAKSAKSLDILRGIEGEAAAKYFSVFNSLIQSKKQGEFIFSGRSKRPPLDEVNAMLSLLYGVLGRDISGALQAVGLDPQIGFLHADRSGRDSLAQDLLEEFRAYCVDSLVTTLINREQVKKAGFSREAAGGVRLNDDTRKALFAAWQEKKQQEIEHPFLKEKVAIGLLPHIQAMLLAAHLRGDIVQYPPFTFK